MSITARIAALKAAPTKPPRWLTAGASNERYHIPEMVTTERQADLYTRLSWLQSAVNIVAQTAAAAALNVERRAGEQNTPIKNHPFEQLLTRPNPLQSRFELLEATFSWRKVAGNAYWWLNRPNESAAPSELWVIPAHQIQPVPDGQSFLRGYVYDAADGRQIPLEPWEVVHFKTWNPLSKYVGLSLLQALRLVGVADIAAQQYSANFYGRDNAKMDGILAFEEFIEEGRWNRLKADWREQYGGTERKALAMLRGAGKGVEFIKTQLSQADMQYLEQRRFTKEEIYDLVAPGLSSVLSVNATEANSTAGKDTFLSMAVYPQHIAVAEKLTNDVLPAYGEDLVAAFEDVRRVDTQVELLEQEAYERTHTIDEVRAKYYGDKPLAPDARTVAQGPKPEPAPMLPAPAAPDLTAAGKALDRQRWQTKTMKALAAGKLPDLVTFDPDYLSDAETMAITGALRRARSAEDVRRAFEGE